MSTNKKLLVVLSVIVAAVLFVVFRSGHAPQSQPAAKADPSFEREIMEIVLVRAENWPTLTDEEVNSVRAKLNANDEVGALEELRAAVYDGVSRRMKEGGYEVTEERWGWDNNNSATAILFIEYPLVKRLGRERQNEFIKCCKERMNWFSVIYDSVTRQEYEKYGNWHTYGQWVFEGEEAPVYKRTK